MSLKAYLQRSLRHDCITGGLAFKGFQCYTLELPWRDNEPDHSSIPAGVYSCGLHHSPKFGLVYRLSGVPGRTDILIHAGNRPADTHGCILVGDSIVTQPDGSTFLQNGKRTLMALHAFTNGEPFTLTIHD